MAPPPAMGVGLSLVPPNLNNVPSVLPSQAHFMFFIFILNVCFNNVRPKKNKNILRNKSRLKNIKIFFYASLSTKILKMSNYIWVK
jgi:hypothetical protein